MFDEEIYRRYKIERALRRSYIKRRIVMYLAVHGFGYPSGIARSICATPTNVCGAIRGMDNRYVTEDSLLSLGVISEMEMKKGDNTKVYCLTSTSGQDAIRMCKKISEV